MLLVDFWVSLILLLPRPSWYQGFSNDTAPSIGGRAITPELSRYVESVRKASNVTGLTLALVSPNGETSLGAWGNKTEDGDKMTPDTLFHMASCSKAFLASSIGILMDDFASGKNVTPLPPGVKEFSWHTKVKDILPHEWELMDRWASEKANIRDILGHVSGLPRHDYSYGPYDSPRDLVHRLRYLRPAFELRQQWSYNNQMFMLGAHIISTYAGSYTSFVRERIFEPLNMTSTTFSVNEANLGGQMTQAWTKTGRRVPHWLNDDVAELSAGAGGIISSAVDMAKWVGAQLNSGRDALTNETVVPKAVFDEVTTAHAVVSGKAPKPNLSVVGYGMGWMRATYMGHEVVNHGGAVPGFSTLVTFLPSDDLGIVVLANTDEKAQPIEDITERVIQITLGHNDSVKTISTEPEPKIRVKPVAASVSTTPETPIPLHKYAGTYSNPGYGSFTLCDSSSDSFYCTAVLADFSDVDSQRTVSNGSELLGEWPRIWSTHVRLVHVENNKFTIAMTALFPRGYGANTTPFETYETGTSEAIAEFVVEDGKVIGFGISGTVGEQTERERWGKTVEDKADAWFLKV